MINLFKDEGSKRYLREYPELSPVVAGMAARARADFGPQAELSLEMNRDPEIDDPHLMLYVRLPQYDRTTVTRLDAIVESFENQLASQAGWVVLTTDFLPPKHAV